MGKARTWVQQELAYRAKDGSRRRGTPGNKGGRKRTAAREQVPHQPRAAIRASQPLHITLRLAPDLGTARRRRMYRAFRRATIVTARKDDVRIVHLSIQSNHVHLLVEADSVAQLGEGMRRFGISAARHINAAVSRERHERRSGRVFVDRFHAAPITSPRQARHALAYVLNNWRRHGVHRSHGTERWLLDPFSSAIHFRGWAEMPDDHVWPIPIGYEPLTVREPASWLLRVGWQRHPRIALEEVPGPMACG